MIEIQRKVFKQDLTGSEETAKSIAVYTWQKDEIAWIVNSARDIFKVQLTGNRWLAGNKWRYEKIYQFTYIEASVDFSHYHGEDLISHRSEDELFVSFLDAYVVATTTLKRDIENYTKHFTDKLKMIEKFKEKMNVEDIKTFYEL